MVLNITHADCCLALVSGEKSKYVLRAASTTGASNSTSHSPHPTPEPSLKPLSPAHVGLTLTRKHAVDVVNGSG
jgi:hypothetical protein